jgi:ribosomal protein L23
MITIGYCTREADKNHGEHLIKTCGLDPKKIQIIEIVNTGNRALTECYNEILGKSIYNHVIFCHNDLTIETKQWGSKLLKQFERNPEYGIMGVAGTKNMPLSGKWWENRKKMYGRVAHTHEGKTWLSSYSEDQGREIEEVIIVDGVFFAIDKSKTKVNFNEAVKGFHFYEITFCFENYLKGVKIGVSTAIRINHKSIGMTNESWETNRLEFTEKFKNNLPVNIKKVLRKGQKLKVLIGCLNFNNYTGSELYVFELAKELVKQGCEVTVCSNIGNPLSAIANKFGIKTHTLQEPPGFKLGDGKWLLKTNEGDIPSQENTLYKVLDVDFDVIHLNHKPVTEHLLRLYPDTPAICSIHSEVITLEEPVISPQIKKYVAIRPEIKEYITDRFNIDPNSVDVIYNPIDTDRFKVIGDNKKKDKKIILFVGTIDYLRKNTIQDLIEVTQENNQEFWIVGKKNDTYLDDIIRNRDHVKYFTETHKVEDYIQQCDETAGILLGRTTIEGWLCGKKGWIYDVDSSGNIKSKKLHDIPMDVDKFKSDNVAKEIIKEYEEILS